MDKDSVAKKGYVAFYTPNSPFWAGKELNSPDSRYTESELGNPSALKLESQAAAEAFRFENSVYELVICRDGLILFVLKDLKRVGLDSPGLHASELNEEHEFLWSLYLDYCNVIFLLTDSAMIAIEKFAYFDLIELTNNHLFPYFVENEVNDGKSYRSWGYGTSLQIHRLRNLFKPEQLFCGNLELRKRLVIHEAVFREMNGMLATVAEEPTKVKLLARLARSIAEYRISNLTDSLVFAWFIIESYIVRKWDLLLSTYIAPSSGPDPIGKEIKKFHKSPANYSTASKLKTLNLAAVISSRHYTQIDGVRRVRNRIIHQLPGDRCTASDCHTAFAVIRDILLEELGLIVHCNLRRSIQGIPGVGIIQSENSN